MFRLTELFKTFLNFKTVLCFPEFHKKSPEICYSIIQTISFIHQSSNAISLTLYKIISLLKKILIIQTASIGDVILATPVAEKLHFFYPEANIDLLIKKGYQDLFQNHPYIKQVVVWDKSSKKYQKLKEIIKLVRHEKYDVVINLQRFASSGLITTLSGSKKRIGFNKNPFSLFFTKRVKHKIGKGKDNPHEVIRNLSLITDLTNSAKMSSLTTKLPKFAVKLYPSQHDYAKVSQYKTKSFITIAPGSLWFTKQYPADKWIEFVEALDKDLVVYFLGSPNEDELCEKIIRESKHKNSLNLAGKFSFLESAALMKDAFMNYTNDSAPMHLASAVNAPVTAIYCSTVPEFGFGPLSEKSFIVQADNPPPCKPCGLHGFKSCPEKHFDCAYLIAKEQLLEKI